MDSKFDPIPTMKQLLFVLLLLAPAIGCSDGSSDETAVEPGVDTGVDSDGVAADPQAALILPERFWSSGSTEKSRDVLDLRDEDLVGQTIAVRGTVKEFVDGFAAFVLVEDTLQSCDEIPGDSCPTPWDYCCIDLAELARGTAFVEFQESGRPGPWTIEGFHGIAQLSEVVVTGTLEIDDADNMSLVATSIRLQ